MVKIGRGPGEAEDEDAALRTRTQAVVSVIIEKTLVNLNVISQLCVGDKLDQRSDGAFIIQKHTPYLFIQRSIGFVSRWTTHTQIQELVASAELLFLNNSGTEAERIRSAIVHTVHGFRNLQKTYEDDALFVASMEVLVQRIGSRFGIPPAELL